MPKDSFLIIINSLIYMLLPQKLSSQSSIKSTLKITSNHSHQPQYSNSAQKLKSKKTNMNSSLSKNKITHNLLKINMQTKCGLPLKNPIKFNKYPLKKPQKQSIQFQITKKTLIIFFKVFIRYLCQVNQITNIQNNQHL